ncbi:MAG: hypothetical protein ACXWV9_07360 [Flavisolibacter sp.]
MKSFFYILIITFLAGFTNKQEVDEIDGLWMGYYRSGMEKEKVIVKFCNKDKIEFYTGGADKQTRCDGSYRISGDSVSFTYATPAGDEFVMKGRMNWWKNFLDGSWKNKDHKSGSFYLEKQKIQERSAQP